MKKNRHIINKYTLSILILLLCLATDIILHKGMARVLLPKSFTDKRVAENFKPCDNPIKSSDKKWVTAVNTVQKIEQLLPDAAGFEMDVYFDTIRNQLHVYHDSLHFNRLSIEDILAVYHARKLSSSIWLDFKNLSPVNEKQSLAYICYLRNKYTLQHKLIVESSFPQLLQSFCDSGFFTSYYTPFFNPYLQSESDIIKAIDTISFNLKNYPTSALSGYYFQYPLLKKFFPGYPILTWADNSKASLVSTIFNRKLIGDERVKIVLYR